MSANLRRSMAETRRKVVVSGVPSELEPSRMVDKLTIHFQTRRRSHGGDVELVEYPTSMNGVAFVTFDRAEDVRILTSGPTASFRQKVLNESLAGGSFRRADGEEMGAGMLSSPGLRRLPVEGTFSKRLLESSRNRKSPQNHLEKGSTSSASKAETSEDIWADLYTFRYIEKFHLEELNEFLNGVDISTKDIEGNELVRITLSEKQASKNFRYVVENLEAFIEFWRSKLRVHSIFYDNYKFFDKRKLVQICKSESSSFAGVLCVFEDSCVKVVGPSETKMLTQKIQ
uniref:RNA binding motif protein 43 n=1 Tax=Cyprinodon variegatus TaxID=28743 RepID=A0A3Q2CL78_CYPVA